MEPLSDQGKSQRAQPVSQWPKREPAKLRAAYPKWCPDKRCGEDVVVAVPHPDDPTMTPNRCPTCFATVVDLKPDPCTNCDGLGHYTSWPHTTCPECHGSGLASGEGTTS